MKGKAKILLQKIQQITGYVHIKLKESLKLIAQQLLLFLRWVSRPKIITSIVGIVFALGTWLWDRYEHFYPEIEIEFTEPLRSNNVFSSILNIKNKGNCSVYNVEIYHVLSDLSVENRHGGKISTEEGVELHTIDPLPIQKIIRPKKSRSIDFDLGRWIAPQYGTLLDGVVTYRANLKLYVVYDYWYNKRTMRDSLFFKTSQLVDGKVLWIND